MIPKFILGRFVDPKWHDELDEKGDNLHTTDDREPCQKSHGASNQADLGVKLDLLVSLYVVKRRRVKIDLNELDCGLWNLLPWKSKIEIGEVEKW